VDIRKRHDILVRIHDFGGYLALDNLTEQAVLNSHGSTFPPQYASHPGLPRAPLEHSMLLTAILTAKRVILSILWRWGAPLKISMNRFVLDSHTLFLSSCCVNTWCP